MAKSGEDRCAPDIYYQKIKNFMFAMFLWLLETFVTWQQKLISFDMMDSKISDMILPGLDMCNNQIGKGVDEMQLLPQNRNSTKLGPNSLVFEQ